MPVFLKTQDQHTVLYDRSVFKYKREEATGLHKSMGETTSAKSHGKVHIASHT
jgi:hypothetical protein